MNVKHRMLHNMWDIPLFMAHPLLLNLDKSKMSK